jgi:hypothetical protein
MNRLSFFGLLSLHSDSSSLEGESVAYGFEQITRTFLIVLDSKTETIGFLVFLQMSFRLAGHLCGSGSIKYPWGVALGAQGGGRSFFFFFEEFFF